MKLRGRVLWNPKQGNRRENFPLFPPPGGSQSTVLGLGGNSFPARLPQHLQPLPPPARPSLSDSGPVSWEPGQNPASGFRTCWPGSPPGMRGGASAAPRRARRGSCLGDLRAPAGRSGRRRGAAAGPGAGRTERQRPRLHGVAGARQLQGSPVCPHALGGPRLSAVGCGARPALTCSCPFPAAWRADRGPAVHTAFTVSLRTAFGFRA